MTARPPDDVPETISHYRLRRLIGSGGMGMVYLATDRRTDVQVAIKILRAELAGDRGFIDRFEREAHLGALLRSPYTAELLQYGSHQGLIYIVMEYVEGQSLRELLNPGPLEVKRALRIGVQVARALEEAEVRGIIHRDIKPDNVMVKAGDSAKVLDFGIARQLAGGTLTMAGGFVGTLSYAAPEQAIGRADHRSDIYAVGATLYHMLAGRPPFVGSIVEILGQQREMPIPLEPLAGVSASVVELLKRALDKDPERRFQSASTLAVAIEQAGRIGIVPEMEEHTAVVAATEIALMGAGGTESTEVVRPAGAAAPTPARALSRAPIFAGLNKTALEFLGQRAVERHYRRGQLLFYEGDPGESLFVVTQGAVKIFRTGPSGDEMVLGVIGETEAFGEIALIDGQGRSASAEATEATRVLAVPRSSLLQLLQSDPALADGLLRFIGKELRRLTGQAGDLVFLDLPGRIAKLLMRLADEQGATGGEESEFQLKLSQGAIAASVGGSRQSVNQILHSFERRGLIGLVGRRVTILKPRDLARAIGE